MFVCYECCKACADDKAWGFTWISDGQSKRIAIHDDCYAVMIENDVDGTERPHPDITIVM